MQISESYRRLARVKEGYQPMLRTKINLEKVRCWDENHDPAKVPDSKFKHADVWPKMVIRTLWFIGSGSWGLTLEVTDLKLREILTACLFLIPKHTIYIKKGKVSPHYGLDPWIFFKTLGSGVRFPT